MAQNTFSRTGSVRTNRKTITLSFHICVSVHISVLPTSENNTGKESRLNYLLKLIVDSERILTQ